MYKITVSGHGSDKYFTYATRAEAIAALERLAMDAAKDNAKDNYARGVVMTHEYERKAKVKK